MFILNLHRIFLRYQKSHSKIARAIEMQTGRCVSDMEDNDFSELKSTFRRMARAYSCSVMEVKQAFRREYYRFQTDEALQKYYGISYYNNPIRCGSRVVSESKMQNISYTNTSNYLFAQWAKEFDDEEYGASSASREAKIVASMTNIDTKDCTQEYISHVYKSLRRLSSRYECPINHRLKEAVLASISFLDDPESLRNHAVKLINVAAPVEAQKYSIAINETGYYISAGWVQERADELEGKQRAMDAAYSKAEEMGISMEDLERTAKELRLAPDLSNKNRMENKLYMFAKQLAEYIGYYYKPFPQGGFYEALIYCSCLLLDFKSNYENELDLDILQDAFFLLLLDELISHTTLLIDQVPDCFNQRVIQWRDHFSPVLLYNACYVSPLHDIEQTAILPAPNEDELNHFSAVLDAMKVQMDINTLKPDIRNLEEEIKERINALKQQGLTSLAISQIIGPLESSPYGLVIDSDYNIFLDDEKKTEIKLPPIHKAVYLLFIKHPEGINFKDMDSFRDELDRYYINITHRNNLNDVRASIERLISPLNNSLNEKCARIKGIFASIVPEDMLKWYIIDGPRGEKKSISLPRTLVIFE